MIKILTVFLFVFLSIVVHATDPIWTVVGDFNGWCNNCQTNALYDNGTHGDLVADDGIFTANVTIASPGRHEWQVCKWNDWEVAFPPLSTGNSWLITTTENQVVKFTFNTNTLTDLYMPNHNIINANDMPGDVIVALGQLQAVQDLNYGPEIMLDNGLNGDSTAGDGIYTWHTIVPSPGTYLWKAGVSYTWDAWGTDNRGVNAYNAPVITTSPDQKVYLYLNKNTGRIASAIDHPIYVSSLTLTALLESMYVTGGTEMINTPSITVELHDASTYTLVDSQTGTLNTAGIGTFIFTTATNSTPYYIVVKSPTTVETWSATAVSFTSGTLIYNFTTGTDKAYTDGSNPSLALHGSKYCIYSGDVNQDGFLTSDDFTGIDNDCNIGDYHLGNDVNGDNFITSDDFTFIDNNIFIGLSRQIPPGAPSSMVKRVVKNHVQKKNNVN